MTAPIALVGSPITSDAPGAAPDSRPVSATRLRALFVALLVVPFLDAGTTVFALVTGRSPGEGNPTMAKVLDHVGYGGFAALRIAVGVALALWLHHRASALPKESAVSRRVGALVPFAVGARFRARAARLLADRPKRMVRVMLFANVVTWAVVAQNLVKIIVRW